MDHSNSYFAYGAGAAPAFDGFETYEEAGGRSGVTAFLPDYELCFLGVPGSSGGGVLALKARKGQVVPGRILRKPRAFSPNCPLVSKVVLTPDGGVVQLPLYMPEPVARRQARAPDEGYLAALRAYRRTLNLENSALDASARGERSREIFANLFVYGTLMRGECRFRILTEECGIENIEPGSVPGRLLDLGAYPGMIDDSGDNARVLGEMCTLLDPGRAFSILDEVEDFLGWESQSSMYERILTRVDLDGGAQQVAWTYRLAAIPPNARELAGGDWRARTLKSTDSGVG